MNILLFMSSGLDTPGPSWHLYTALIEDLVSYGHKVHLILPELIRIVLRD